MGRGDIKVEDFAGVKNLMVITYADQELQKIPFTRIEEIGDDSHKLKDKKFSGATFYSRWGDEFYSKHDHYERTLRNLLEGREYFVIPAPAQVAAAVTSAPTPVGRARESIQAPSTIPAPTPDVIPSVPAAEQRATDNEEKKQKYAIPGYDGKSVHFGGGINCEVGSKKLSFIERISTNSGWDVRNGIGHPVPIERNWTNLLNEAEKRNTSVVARGVGRSLNGFYFLFYIGEDFKRTFKDMGLEKYLVSNLKQEGAVVSLNPHKIIKPKI